MKYVIIGSSTAAVGAVEGIRSVDRDGEIMMITEETRMPYSRPLISYKLMGKITEEDMNYRPATFMDDMAVTFKTGLTATAIDPAAKTAALSDGSIESYDKLLVATGSSPAVPPIPGLRESKDRVAFMSVADEEQIEAKLTADSRVLIIGAGLIGLKCAEALAHKAASVTVADIADHVLPSILDVPSAAPVQAKLEEHGVKFMLGNGASSFEEGKANMSDGSVCEYDILVVAVGVRPNTSLVKDAGGEVNRGIICDERMMTSIPDVYAAGDCTESDDISAGVRRILAILPGAYMQGECAGINMAGGDKVYNDAIPMNAIGFFGFHILSAGSYTGEEYSYTTEKGSKKLFVEDGVLKGFMLIGDVEKAGIYTSLVRNRTPITEIDFEKICKSPTLAAFSEKSRAHMLGGVV